MFVRKTWSAIIPERDTKMHRRQKEMYSEKRRKQTVLLLCVTECEEDVR